MIKREVDVEKPWTDDERNGFLIFIVVLIGLLTCIVILIKAAMP